MAAGKYVNYAYASCFGFAGCAFFGSPFIKERPLKIAHSRIDKNSFYFLEITKLRQEHWDNMMLWYGLDLRGDDKKLLSEQIQNYHDGKITQETLKKYFDNRIKLEMEDENLDHYRSDNHLKGFIARHTDNFAWKMYQWLHINGKYRFYRQYDDDSFLLKAKLSRLVLDHAVNEGTLESYSLGTNTVENEVNGLLSGKIGLKFSNGNIWHGNIKNGYLKEGIYEWTEMDMQYDGAEGICSWIRDVKARDLERWKNI